ncbi:MAG TPA: glycoside hydrolase family 3 N-terminal domain-containing protein [Solirubrobacteraceae bacterium]|nr:glycoside hydrolase family 3 N-terminal domain-containing protein [Solirubrobacteraceae bacterium]
MRRWPLVVAGLAMAVAAVVVLLVSGASEDGGSEPVREGGSRFADGGTTATTPAPSAGSNSAVERDAAQLFVAGFASERGPQRVWGGLLLTDANFSSDRQLRGLVRRELRRARREKRPVPLVWTDPAALPGLGPAAQPTIGAEGTQRDARTTALRSGRRLARVGVDLVLAPSADLGATGTAASERSFGDDAERSAAFTFQAVDGWRTAGVLPVPGRFPGEGAASQDPVEGPATVGLSLDELVARDVRPFAGVAERAPAVQMSAAVYAAWDGVTPATLLPEAVSLLRERLGFRGAVVSADLGSVTAATGGSVGDAAVAALQAGCDVLLVPGGRAEQDEALRAVVAAVASGKVPRARFREAVARVAALREAAR